jgi:transcription elongation factor S-II
MKLILNLERGIFNSSITQYNENSIFNEKTWNDVFKAVYLNKALSIYLNLNPSSDLKNTNLLVKLLTGEISEFELCNLQAKELHPERWIENMKHCGLLNTEQQTVQNISLEERPDGILKCGKCKSWKTEYTERQTRSADEPTSKFCYCHNCGNRWRFC